jgi:rSAM/selenodomain-associated transferase 1
MKNQALIIFTKNAEPGKVKTRLAATVGNVAAFAVFQKLSNYTAGIAAGLNVEKFVFYSDYIPAEDLWSGATFYKNIQQGISLGDRMSNAFADAFEKQFERVVIIGTDCPGLDQTTLEKAFEVEGDHDVVLGPAADGGYYLIGTNRYIPALFENIQWSTSEVLMSTISICRAHHLSYYLLPVLHDVDEEKDLVHLSTLIN